MSADEEYKGAEALSQAQKLIKIRTDPDKWETEYRNDVTGEVWILDYPDSGQQGGGSPRLRKK